MNSHSSSHPSAIQDDSSLALQNLRHSLTCNNDLAGLRQLQVLEDSLKSVESSRSSQVVSSSSKNTKRRTPPFVACTLCRRCKAKCRISDPSSDQCDRCKATGCVCTFAEHKRGRKRTRGLDLPRAGEASSGRLTTTSDQQSEHPKHPDTGISQGLGHSTDSSSTLHRSPLSWSIPVEPIDSGSEDEGEGSAKSPPVQNTAAHPLPFISGSRRPFSLHNILNPTPVPANTRPPRPTYRRPRGDLVSRGLLSLDIAHQLFSYFFRSLNPVILLFDPVLHTFEYVREKSAFLFSSILSASASFIAPSVSGLLARIVVEYSVRAILSGRCTIETIQSWMVMYFWKSRRDTRAWIYVGLICRAAIEIGLNVAPNEDDSGATEIEQRERRNQARTWMLAFMMDRAMASATGRDWSIRPSDQIIRHSRNFSNHLYRNHGDAVIAGFTELRVISSEAMGAILPRLETTGVSSQEVASRQLLVINYDLDEWKAFWTAETDKYQSPPIYMALLSFFELHIRLTLNSFAVKLKNTSASPSFQPSDSKLVRAERYCYELAVDSLLQLRLIHQIDGSILHHAQDSMSVMVAYAACFLQALISSNTFTHEERVNAILLISQTSAMFKEVSQNPDTTAALQAEFLQNLAAHAQAMEATDSEWQIPTLARLSDNHLLPDGTYNSEATGALKEDFLSHLNAQSQVQQTPGLVMAINDPTRPNGSANRSQPAVDDWLSVITQDWGPLFDAEPSGEDLLPEPPRTRPTTAAAALLPHDVANFEWDQLVLDWLQTPPVAQ